MISDIGKLKRCNTTIKIDNDISNKPDWKDALIINYIFWDSDSINVVRIDNNGEKYKYILSREEFVKHWIKYKSVEKIKQELNIVEGLQIGND